jgi:hypothetical protein
VRAIVNFLKPDHPVGEVRTWRDSAADEAARGRKKIGLED